MEYMGYHSKGLIIMNEIHEMLLTASKIIQFQEQNSTIRPNNQTVKHSDEVTKLVENEQWMNAYLSSIVTA